MAKKKLSDFIVISDVDGTLIDHEIGVPKRNRDAIYRFIEAGGRFGIATGRSRGLMLEAAGDLPINAPCVLYNGGALYDHAADKILWELFLPENAGDYVREMMDAVPGMGVLVIRDDSYYQVKEELAFANYFASRGEENFKVQTMDKVETPWYKILFQIHEEQYAGFFEEAAKRCFPGVRFVGTNTTLIEMLPEASSKGLALEKLVDMGLVERENLVAVGDFYNDIEMIEYAGIGVTLTDSPDEIKAIADVVVGTCRNGAIADTIEHLEALCAD